MQALSTNFRNMSNHRIKDFVTTMMAFSHVQMTKLYVRERARAPFPNSEWPSCLMTKTKKCNTGSCGKVLNMVNDLIVKYSRTFTNSHLSTTACSFNPTDSPYIHSNFNLAAKAIKALPNCKTTSRLMNCLYKTPYCYCKR